MSTLNFCDTCKIYTLKLHCPKCQTKTTSAHYQFKKIRNAPPRSVSFKR